RLGQQLLEPRVLRFQRLQALGVGHVHAAELAPPQVERRVTEAVLAAQLLDWRASRRFLEEADDLLFGVSLLHVRPLVRRTLLSSDGPGSRGAGQIGRETTIRLSSWPADAQTARKSKSL